MSTSFDAPASGLGATPAPLTSEPTPASAQARSGAGTPDFGPATDLVCRECGASYALGAAYACIECFGPLEVGYDLSGVTRELIESGPQ
ncbi:MAG TPA: hypothetical protein VFL59_08215, partial [Candidatus Nanopelagicales bacterium]|nr:hypothetical protein [Candidatus Nanopelagicales bacterium]